MKYKLALCGLFCAALVSGCSSPPKLPEPSGSWEDFNPPIAKPAVNGNGGGVNVQKK